MSANQESWKLTLPCTRVEAEAIDAEDDLVADAVMITTEETSDDDQHWRLDVYVGSEPSPELIRAIRALVPSAATVSPEIERLASEDWVTMSQAGLKPIREGRFIVHTAAHIAAPPEGGRAFVIEAGQAFGTGHHETTAGCLAMLDRLASSGRRFDSVIDLGTGTGLLAFAARFLWPEAKVSATDVDPVAIHVTAENAATNGVGDLTLTVADGARHEGVAASAPYDLVIANILAGPLIAMAEEMIVIAAPGATIVLAGLLRAQFDDVRDAYAALGCVAEDSEERGDWSIVRLLAPGRSVAAPTRDGEDGAG